MLWYPLLSAFTQVNTNQQQTTHSIKRLIHSFLYFYLFLITGKSNDDSKGFPEKKQCAQSLSGDPQWIVRRENRKQSRVSSAYEEQGRREQRQEINNSAVIALKE
jgi:hypothetical protein